MTEPAEAPGRGRVLADLAGLFLRLGATAFGGPAAHVAMMEVEVVRRRAWLSREAFLDLLGTTHLIPGPNSTELALLIGQQRAGLLGLCVAGMAFITPALLAVMALSAVYVRQGQFPALAALLYGVKPVIIAIVLQALVHLASTALRRRATLRVGLCALALGLLGVHELIVLALSGLALVLGLGWPRQPRVLGVAWLGGLPALAITPASMAAPFHLTTLFLAFLKVGATLFGSGYVLLAFMRAEFVLRLGWLSESQLLDAVAIGQATPGPVFTTATSVGYLLGGPVGALVATVGIFLPAFVFVAASGPLIPRLRGSAHASAFLDGVNAASVALMALVSVPLARDALPDGPSLLLAGASTLLLLRYRVNSTWLVLAGAGLGGLRAWLA